MTETVHEKQLEPHEILREIRDLLPDCMLKERMILSRQLKKFSHARKNQTKELSRLLKRGQESAKILRHRRNNTIGLSYPESLPLSARKQEILDAIKEHPVVIVAGETGSGKTTQLPKICLEAGRGIDASIACTQPRRVAALSVSKRIAEELGVKWGQEVGCKIRFSDETVPDTRIKMMTDGMLLAEVQNDPDLYEYDTIIIDEAHERSLNIDFLLGYLRVLRKKRPELKIVITSATIDVDTFSAAFDNAPIVEVSGRVYPVEIRYEPGELEVASGDDYTYIDATVDAVDKVRQESSKGDVLIFMPTEKDIHETRRRLEGRSLPRTDVLPLFGRLTASDQQRVFSPQKGRRRIVIATNIAETSLTIPGIRYVIDPGLARLSRYNPRNQTHRLPIEPISQSSAKQRAGRCGRVAEGVCLRLYTEGDLKHRSEYTQPEIQRSNLAEVILRMLSLRLGDIRSFPFIDPPRPQAINGGFQLLAELGAIDGNRRLTDLGRDMARMPIDPTVSRMVLQARKEGALHEVLVIASAISIQDPRVRPLDKQKEADGEHSKFVHPESDFLTLLNIWNAYHDQFEHMDRQSIARRFCKQHYISFNRMREWRDIYTQLRRILREIGFHWHKDPAGYDAVHRSILCGLLGSIAQKKDENLYRAARSRDVMLFPGSGLFIRKADPKKPEKSPSRQKPTPAWVMAAEIVETSRLFARTAARIQPAWIADLGGHLMKSTFGEPVWDERAGRVTVVETSTLYGLQVRRKSVSYHKVNPLDAREIFIREGLVEERLAVPPGFVKQNQLVRQKLDSWMLLRRGADLVINDALFMFYDERIPDVSSLAGLEAAFRENTPPISPDSLVMKIEDLVGARDVEVNPNDFPPQLAFDGERLSLSYAYSPGSIEDGVTITIPAKAVNSVPAVALEWLVPGLLTEKITALLRGLPKAVRKHFVPIPDAAKKLAQILKPSHQSLLGSLGALIARDFGLQIDRSDWRIDHLPDYLRMGIRVEAEDGSVVYKGRDLREIQDVLQDQAELAASDVFTGVALEWDQFDLRGWTFGDLPERVEVSQTGVVPVYGYPGLYLEDDMVCIRLFRDSVDAERESRGGVTRLYELTLKEELAWVRRDLAQVSHFSSLRGRLGTSMQFELAAYDYLVDLVLLDGSVFPLTQARFEEGVRAARELFPGAVPRFIERLSAIDMALQAVSKKSDAYCTVQTDIERLVPPNFLSLTPFQRLEDVSRYLRAIEVRADRARLDRVKDQRKADLVAPYQIRMDRLGGYNLTAGSGAGLLIDEYRWMLEEFRVSTLAQELGTRMPVSEKRLNAKLHEIELALKTTGISA